MAWLVLLVLSTSSAFDTGPFTGAVGFQLATFSCSESFPPGVLQFHVSQAQFNYEMCGACVEVVYLGTAYYGKIAGACAASADDLGDPRSTGYFAGAVDWVFVDCPDGPLAPVNSGKLVYSFTSMSNSYYQQISIENSRSRIASAAVKVPDGTAGFVFGNRVNDVWEFSVDADDTAAVHILLIDIHGEALEDVVVPLSYSGALPSQTFNGGKQFTTRLDVCSSSTVLSCAEAQCSFKGACTASCTDTYSAVPGFPTLLEYRFDEGLGDTVYDYGMFGWDLEMDIAAAFTWSADGLSHTSSGAYNTLATTGPPGTVMDFLDDKPEFSIVLKVKVNSLTDVGPVRIFTMSEGTDCDDFIFHIGQEARKLSFRVAYAADDAVGCNQLTTADVFTDNAFHIIVATFDSEQLCVYKDGVKVFDHAIEFPTYTLRTEDYSGNTRIGAFNEVDGLRTFKGTIGRVSMYSGAFTSELVERLYQEEVVYPIDDCGFCDGGLTASFLRPVEDCPCIPERALGCYCFTCECHPAYASADCGECALYYREDGFGDCEVVPCGPHSSGEPDCTCDAGYQGSPTYTVATKVWSGCVDYAPQVTPPDLEQLTTGVFSPLTGIFVSDQPEGDYPFQLTIEASGGSLWVHSGLPSGVSVTENTPDRVILVGSKSVLNSVFTQPLVIVRPATSQFLQLQLTISDLGHGGLFAEPKVRLVSQDFRVSVLEQTPAPTLWATNETVEVVEDTAAALNDDISSTGSTVGSLAFVKSANGSVFTSASGAAFDDGIVIPLNHVASLADVEMVFRGDTNYNGPATLSAAIVNTGLIPQVTTLYDSGRASRAGDPTDMLSGASIDFIGTEGVMFVMDGLWTDWGAAPFANRANDPIGDASYELSDIKKLMFQHTTQGDTNIYRAAIWFESPFPSPGVIYRVDVGTASFIRITGGTWEMENTPADTTLNVAEGNQFVEMTVRTNTFVGISMRASTIVGDILSDLAPNGLPLSAIVANNPSKAEVCELLGGRGEGDQCCPGFCTRCSQDPADGDNPLVCQGNAQVPCGSPPCRMHLTMLYKLHFAFPAPVEIASINFLGEYFDSVFRVIYPDLAPATTTYSSPEFVRATRLAKLTVLSSPVTEFTLVEMIRNASSAEREIRIQLMDTYYTAVGGVCLDSVGSRQTGGVAVKTPDHTDENDCLTWCNQLPNTACEIGDDPKECLRHTQEVARGSGGPGHTCYLRRQQNARNALVPCMYTRGQFCYMWDTDSPGNFFRAHTRCAYNNGDVLSVHSAEELSDVLGALQAAGATGSVALGLTNFGSDEFRWTDGTPGDFDICPGCSSTGLGYWTVNIVSRTVSFAVATNGPDVVVCKGLPRIPVGGPQEDLYKTVHFDVTPYNDGVQLTSVPFLVVLGGQEYTYSIVVFDPDNDPEDISFVLVAGPPGMSISSNGTVTWFAPKSLTGEDYSTDMIHVEVSDLLADGATPAAQYWTISVVFVNEAPVILQSEDVIMPGGSELRYEIPYEDPDDDNGSGLFWTLLSAPPGVALSSLGVLTWTPGEGVLSSGPLSVELADGGEDDAEPAVAIFAVRVNYPPTDIIFPTTVPEEQDGNVGSVSVVDPNDDDVHIFVVLAESTCVVDESQLPVIFLLESLDYESLTGGNECMLALTAIDPSGEQVSAASVLVAANVNELPTLAPVSWFVTDAEFQVAVARQVKGGDPEGMVGSVFSLLSYNDSLTVTDAAGTALIPGDPIIQEGAVASRDLIITILERGKHLAYIALCVEDSEGLQSCSDLFTNVSVACADVARDYRNTNGHCRPCGRGRFSDGEELCRSCREGSYWVSRGRSPTACLPCPPGALCRGGGELPTPRPGFWNSPNSEPEDFDMVPCQPAEACLGGSECRKGHNGLYCAACETAYYKVDGLCNKCPPATEIVFAGMFLCMLLLCLVLIKLARHSTQYFASLSVGFNFLQIVAILGTFDLAWPQFLLDVFNVISVFNFDVQLFRAECAVSKGKSPYVYIWLLKILLPAFFMAMLFGINVVARCYAFLRKKLACESKWFPEFGGEDLLLLRRSSINALMSVLVFMYLIITSTSLTIYGCKELSDSGIYLMIDEPEVECYKSEWNLMLGFSLASLALYSLGFPAVVASTLYKRRLVLHRDKNVIRFGLLFQRYKAHLYLFELCILARKLGIVIGKVIFANNPIAQAAVALASVTISAISQFILGPYRSHRVNALDKLHLVCAAFVLACGILFASTVNLMSEGGRAALGSIIIVVLVLNCLAILLAVVLELNHLRQLSSRGLAGRFASDRVNTGPGFFGFDMHVLRNDRVYDTDTTMLLVVFRSKVQLAITCSVVGENLFGTGECILVGEDCTMVDSTEDGTEHYISVLVKDPGRYVLVVHGSPIGADAELQSDGKKGEEVELMPVGTDVPQENEAEGGHKWVHIIDMALSVETRSFPGQKMALTTPLYTERSCVLKYPTFKTLWLSNAYQIIIDAPHATALTISSKKPVVDESAKSALDKLRALNKSAETGDEVLSSFEGQSKVSTKVEGTEEIPMFRGQDGMVGVVEANCLEIGPLYVWGRYPTAQSIKEWTGQLEYTDFEKLIEFDVRGIDLAVHSEAFTNAGGVLVEPTQRDLVEGNEYHFLVSFEKKTPQRVVLHASDPGTAGLLSGNKELLTVDDKTFRVPCLLNAGKTFLWAQFPGETEFVQLVEYNVEAHETVGREDDGGAAVKGDVEEEEVKVGKKVAKGYRPPVPTKKPRLPPPIPTAPKPGKAPPDVSKPKLEPQSNPAYIDEEIVDDDSDCEVGQL